MSAVFRYCKPKAIELLDFGHVQLNQSCAYPSIYSVKKTTSLSERTRIIHVNKSTIYREVECNKSVIFILVFRRDNGGQYYTFNAKGKQVTVKSPYPHGNTVGNQAAECYSLQCRRSGQVKKYGETTHGESRYGVGNQKRYSINWLEENKLEYVKEATGTKKEMKALQTKKIKEHTKVHGKRPDLNKTDQ